MNLKNFIVSSLVWITFLIAIVLGIDSFTEGKNFHKFAKLTPQEQILYDIKEKLIYQKSFQIDKNISDTDDYINTLIIPLTNKEEYKNLSDEKKKQIKKNLKEFIKNINSIKDTQSLQSLLEISKNKAQNVSLEDETYANVYSNYLNAKTIIVSVILGFLSVFFVIKIEWDRLENERKHYRKQAKDNVSDILNYSMNLLEDIDKKHVDFMYSLKEMREVCSNIDKIIDYEKIEVSKKYSYLTKFISIDRNDLFSECEKVYKSLKFDDYKYHKNIVEKIILSIKNYLIFIPSLIFVFCKCDYSKSLKENLLNKQVVSIDFTAIVIILLVIGNYFFPLPSDNIKIGINIILVLYFLLSIWMLDVKLNQIISKLNDENILNKYVYFSISFVRFLLKDEKLKKELCKDNEDEKLKALYYSTLSHNLREYIDKQNESKENKTHTINEEVHNITKNIEEIVLKKDFEIDDKFAKKYLSVVDGIKNFENILEGSMRIDNKYITRTQSNSGNKYLNNIDVNIEISELKEKAKGGGDKK